MGIDGDLILRLDARLGTDSVEPCATPRLLKSILWDQRRALSRTSRPLTSSNAAGVR
jgi:hypothetical protein